MNSLKFYRTNIIIIAFAILVFLCFNVFADDYEFEISCPYWYILFNRAGYVDYTKWYPSERHGYGPHEMCTGDIAGAVWYQNVATGNQSAWLVNHFVIPDFSPTTPFVMGGKSVWNDPCNPVWTDPCQPTGYIGGTQTYVQGLPYGDTAWSEVNDIVNGGKLQVKIYYEVVDLGEQDANGVGGSPMAFRDPNGNPVYVYSERYVLLLTYVFKNLSTTSDINGLEFYQMMHGHPADAYSNLAGCYETANYTDPLANYSPCDSNHHTGNFIYDITLWNNPQYTGDEHIDYMSFSSTIEPNDYGFNCFCDYCMDMESDIRNRNLNGRTSWQNNDMAGAAKWNLGNLSTGQTKSITLALMYGAGPIHTTPPEWACVTLTNTNDMNSCVLPLADVNYSIFYSTTCDINDVNIIDELIDVDFNSCTGGGVYNEPNHTVTWSLGNRQANDSNCFTLHVKVAQDAIGGSTLTNTVKMYSGSTIIKTATKNTQVCCMNPVAYVKWNATGSNNGSSWTNAYTNLQTALQKVRDGLQGCANQIWVAKGTYKPTEANDTNPSGKTFAMISGKNMYGHFDGNETSIDNRNLADSNNETILSGDIDDNNTSDVKCVVTAANARLDGFTVRKSKEEGILCSGCSPTIADCVVKYNDLYGIYCTYDANVTLFNTFVSDNGNAGIFCNNANTYINIDHCTIGPNNTNYGLYVTDSCAINATDSIFSGSTYYSGIYASSSNLNVERCDFSDNGKNYTGSGIYCSGTIANIRKCVIQRNYYGLFADSSDIVNAALNIISDNSSYGVYIPYSDNCRLMSNLIYRNSYYGIYVSRPAEIRNNSIISNTQYGIYGSGSGLDSNVVSNIIYSNGTDGLYGSFTPAKVNFNCIQSAFSGGQGNITDNPQFRNANANDYHLLSSSPCIDRGDPNFTGANELYIGGEFRVMDGDFDGNVRVDMGADEFKIVDFINFSIFANAWRTDPNNPKWNAVCDFVADNIIDTKDLAVFVDNWLLPSDWNDIGGEGAYFEQTSGEGGSESMEMQPEQEFMMESQEELTPAIYLICDNNTPEPNEEVTVQIYSDAPLFCMGLFITVTGDAEITDAMSTVDCNEYGWDPDWPTDPYIDPDEGWLYVSGVKWEGGAEGVVGYFKFRYNSGQVSVSIMEDSAAYDSDCAPVGFSTQALMFESDPNA